MKTWIALFFMLACVPAFAETSESQIKMVELSPRGAIVHRGVTASLEDGRLLIPNLPAALDPASIRIDIISPEGVGVANFRFSNIDPEDNPLHEEISTQLKEINRQIENLTEERQLIEEQIAYSLQLANAVRVSLQEQAAADAFELGKRAWEEYSSTRKESRTRTAEISTALEALENDQAELQEQLGKVQQQSGLLTVDLTGAQDAAVIAVELAYHLDTASWQPLYEIRADPTAGQLTWVCKARIRQNTGEDWEEARVTLSTAAPQLVGMPELQPFILGQVYQGRGSLGRIASYAPPPPPPSSKMSAQEPAELGRSTVSFHASLRTPISLKSGEDELVREVARGITTVDYWSQAVPELSPDAWLMAGGDFTLEWPIIEAQALVFIDDHLVAKRQIESLKPGEEFELALGKNENIAIERKERRRNASEGGVFDRTRRVDVVFQTQVKNFMPVPHRIVLKDRFPISHENKIQVRREEPGDVEVEEGTGVFDWERTIPAGGATTMTTRYVVSYPAEWTINGDF